MWTIFKYKQIGQFALRPTLSTGKGRVSLPLPHPYAIKTAIIKYYMRYYNKSDSIPQDKFDEIKNLKMIVLPPDYVIINGFTAIKYNGNKKNKAPTYTEKVFWKGELHIAIKDVNDWIKEIMEILPYIGQKDGLIRYVGNEEVEKIIPSNNGIICMMDDFDKNCTWDHINKLKEVESKKCQRSDGRITNNTIIGLKLKDAVGNTVIYKKIKNDK